MRKALSWAGIVVAAILLLPMIQAGFGLSFGELLSSLVAFGQSAIEILSDPALWLLSAILNAMNWDIALNEHWRFVWTLLMIYFARDFANALGRGNFAGAILGGMVGVTVAIGASLLSGRLPLASGNSDLEFKIVLYPIAALFLYSIFGLLISGLLKSQVPESLKGKSFWAAFRHRAIPSIIRNAGFAAIAFSLLHFQIFSEAAAPSIAVIFIVITFLAFYWLTFGPFNDVKSRPPEKTWWEAYRATPHVGTGSAMLKVLVLDGTIILADALLK